MIHRRSTLALALAIGMGLATVGHAPAVAAAAQQEQANDVPALVLSAPEVQSLVVENGAKVSVDSDATKIVFDAVSEAESSSKWPGAKFYTPEKTWDWNTKGGLKLNVTNPSDHELYFEIKLADNLGMMGNAKRQLDLPVRIPAGETKDVEFRFSGSAMKMAGYRGGEELDLRQLSELTFYTVGPVPKQTLLINNIDFLEGTGDLVKSEVLETKIVNDPIPTIKMLDDFNEGKKDLIELTLGSTATFFDKEDGDKAVRIAYDNENEYPTIKFSAEKPWDWSKLGEVTLGFDLVNETSAPAQFYMRIDDRVDQKLGGEADGVLHSRVGAFQVAANASGTYYFTLADLEKTFDAGMRGLPPRKAYQAQQVSYAWGEKKLDTSNIVSIQIFQMKPEHSVTVTVDNLRLLPNLSADDSRYADLIDQYGQYKEEEWSTKIHNDKELQANADKDRDLIKNAKLMPDRSKFGGWKDGPKLKGTGYFRTEKVDGKWAFVDPDGYLYFATGLDNIRMHDTYTTTGMGFADEKKADANSLMPSAISDKNYAEIKKPRVELSKLRHSMFTELPGYDDPLSANYQYVNTMHAGPLDHGEVYSFYGSNVQRKFAPTSKPESEEVWRDEVLSRMMDWGFTSLGNWSDPAFYANEKVPYTAHGWILGQHQKIKTGNDYWGPMHDPFDPEFRKSVHATTERVAKQVNDSPWCLGVFIDNELTWGNMQFDGNHYLLAVGALRGDEKSSFAKAAFMDILKAKYDSVDALNKSWGSQFASWDELGAGYDFTGEFTKNIKADFSSFLSAHADKYFAVVSSEVKKSMPHHMFMGSRFAVWGMTPEAQEAAAKYVDVMSYNLYANDLDDKGDWSELEKLDKPSMIGEFAFGALDTGMFHPGPMGVENQTIRGEKFQHYLTSVMNNPYFVGAHWFQYLDSPVTGRAWDGENYNNGFVNVTDTPYQEMVDAAKEFHATLYEKRYGDLKK